MAPGISHSHTHNRKGKGGLGELVGSESRSVFLPEHTPTCQNLGFPQVTSEVPQFYEAPSKGVPR